MTVKRYADDDVSDYIADVDVRTHFSRTHAAYTHIHTHTDRYMMVLCGSFVCVYMCDQTHDGESEKLSPKLQFQGPHEREHSPSSASFPGFMRTCVYLWLGFCLLRISVCVCVPEFDGVR